MRKKFYSNLCIKSITGNITEKEVVILTRWLNESDANQKEYELLRNTWTGISNNKESHLPDLDIAWDKLNSRFNNENKGSDYKTKWYEVIPETFFQPLYKPVIATIIIIILIAVYIIQIKNEPVPIVSVSTIAGEKRTVTLPDGSSVILNYASKIQYPKNFSKTREVQLDGEAFFSVNKNVKQFIVKTNNAIVTVTGTKFFVKSSEVKTEISVKEGKVNVRQLNSDENGLNISAGQRGRVENDLPPSAPEVMDSDDTFSWMNNVLTFNQTPLYELKSELEKLYGVPIIIEQEEINNLTLTGSFRFNTPIDSVLDMVCLAFELKYEKQLDKYTISAR